MKKFLILLTLCLGLSSFATERPNVLLVLTDDQGIGDLGCYGNTLIKTPNIDKFSTQSVNLMDFHVDRACAPTRASLMTGRFCNRTGLCYTITQRAIVRKDESTIALQLKKSGYTTAMFGKWHLGDMKPYRAEDKGFDHVVRHGSGGIGQTTDYWDNTYFDDTYFVNSVPQKFEGYCTDVFTTECIKFIKTAVKEEKPFFCYLATNAPHGPYRAPKEYLDMYKGKKVVNSVFYAMITNLDDNFKRLMDTLDELNIADNTIVIFMTDNGTAAGIASKSGNNGDMSKGFNLGMKGKKASEYDGGHRVPCIIRYPNGGINSEKRIDTLTAHIDIMPTLLDWCTTEYDGIHALDGTSMKNLINNGDETGFKGRILVTDSHIPRMPTKWAKCATMQDKYRLVNGKELYDVSKDPSQKNDISASMPEKVAELRSFYSDWYDSIYQGENLKVNPIYIYKNEQNLLDAHYMQPFNDQYPAWNQSMVKQGKQNTGTWEIFIQEDGEYTFSLRRYPIEFDKPITWGAKTNKALAIKTANLTIDGKLVGESAVTAKDHSIDFTVNLTKGRHVVESLFQGNKIKLSTYYIYVK